MTNLTTKQEAFAAHMASPDCPGPLEAYRRAGYNVGDTPRKVQTAAENASRLQNDPKVAARITELREKMIAPIVADAAFVLREWLELHLADPNELTTTRRFCCRHCYGEEHKYQWINDDEFAIECAQVIDYNAKLEGTRRHRKPMPDYAGGVGYERNKVPHPSCPQCSGDGLLDVYIADMRTVSPRARRLFAGVKTTQNGIEVKMRDQDGALANIARYLGMFVERHMHGGDPSNPTPIKAASLVGDLSAQDAAKLYQAAISGGK